jgi:hypothetical protein
VYGLVGRFECLEGWVGNCEYYNVFDDIQLLEYCGKVMSIVSTRRTAGIKL